MKQFLFISLLIAAVFPSQTVGPEIEIIPRMVYTPEIRNYHLVEELIRDANDVKFKPKLDKEYFVKHWEKQQHNTQAEETHTLEGTLVKIPLLVYQQQQKKDEDWLIYKVVFVVTFTIAALCVGRDRKETIMAEEKEEEQKLS